VFQPGRHLEWRFMERLPERYHRGYNRLLRLYVGEIRDLYGICNKLSDKAPEITVGSFRLSSIDEIAQMSGTYRSLEIRVAEPYFHVALSAVQQSRYSVYCVSAVIGRKHLL
jgi:hypothetical protein